MFRVRSEGSEVDCGLVILRSARDEDVPALMRTVKDPELAKAVDLPHPFSASQARRWIRGGPRRLALVRHYRFVIQHKATSDVVGAVGLDYEQVKQSMELSYWLAPEWQNQGLGTRVVLAACKLAVVMLPVRVICARVAITNIASKRLLEKIGMKKRGYEFNALYCNGLNPSLCIYAIDKKELSDAN